MRAKMHDCPLEWHVASERDPSTTYHVSLGWRAGNGHCTCDHFQFRMRPAIEAGAAPPTGGLCRCKHIDAARDALATHIIHTLNNQ